MRLNRIIKVVLPLVLLLLLGPPEPVNIWVSPWTQVTDRTIKFRQLPSRNAGNAAPSLASNNIFSELPDRAAALWSPLGKDGVGFLHAIDALSPDNIWAVGETLDKPSKALVMHWDGVEWSTTTRFNVAQFEDIRVQNPGTRLYDVVALAPDDVWAVGEDHTLVSPPVREDHTFIDTPSVSVIDNICCWTPNVVIAHWDGKLWQIMPNLRIAPDNRLSSKWDYALPPDGSSAYGSLRAITSVAKDDVWAVGESRERQTLIMHWDGKSWEVVNGPFDLEDRPYPLYDITATSANDIWAVGGETIIRWDGKVWSEPYKLESESFFNPGFQSIAALSQNDIWVVASSHMSTAQIHSNLKIMHWDGTAWTRITSLYCNDICNLTSIHAVSKDDIWVTVPQTVGEF